MLTCIPCHFLMARDILTIRMHRILNTIDMPCIRLVGLSGTNCNVARRGVVIHEAPFFADDISIGIPIPVTDYISQGCFGISTEAFNMLQDLMIHNKSIYLYAVYKCE
jgi:hypothetical protein